MDLPEILSLDTGGICLELPGTNVTKEMFDNGALSTRQKPKTELLKALWGYGFFHSSAGQNKKY